MEQRTESRFLIRPGTAIQRPKDKGWCKNCTSRESNGYCRALDDSCDKVWICRSFFYKRPE